MPRSSDARTRRRGRSRFRRDEGQTFVFMATLLFGLLVIVGTVINVGQAINRRVMLQVVADAGAYTGATEMARGMNTMAERNGRIQRGWQKLNKVFKWYVPCEVSGYAVEAYRSLHGWETDIINAVNNGFGMRASSEARAVSEYNAEDLFPSRYGGTESLVFAEDDGSIGLGAQRPKDYVVWTETVPEGTPPKAAGGPSAKKRIAYECLTSGRKPVRTKKTAVVDLWYRKTKGTAPVAFVWVVKAPSTRARFFDDVFGPYLIPEMTAVAVAKPIGGDLENGDARYVTKLIPLRDLRNGVRDTWNNRWRTISH